ncbi:MAG: succinylglutamate desuccinylase [Planctomycetota bacterium]|nr:MAG: succinylglutamate desuccinylase [Planctomycetota bacterium]
MSPFEIANVVFTGSQPGPHLLITAGVHGDEFEGMAAVWRLIARFSATESGVELGAGTLTLVPVVNEQAFHRGTRTADDGLDLARTCPGDPEGSITQQAAHALSQLIDEADCYIDLHSGGRELSVWPMTGYILHADAEVLDRQRAMARAFGLPVVWGTSPELEGRSLSVARDLGVPAIYAEFYGSGMCNPHGVDAYTDGCLNVMRHLGMIAGEPSRRPIELVVEDPRPDSGHLQICNPSPTTGFFQPAVTLGRRVSSGDLLGRVTDVTGGDPHEIRTPHAGLVLVLRTFASVEKGQTVGVVLETN